MDDCLCVHNTLGYEVRQSQIYMTKEKLFGICITVAPRDGYPTRGPYFKPTIVQCEPVYPNLMHVHVGLLPYSTRCGCVTCMEHFTQDQTKQKEHRFLLAEDLLESVGHVETLSISHTNIHRSCTATHCQAVVPTPDKTKSKAQATVYVPDLSTQMPESPLEMSRSDSENIADQQSSDAAVYPTTDEDDDVSNPGSE